MKDDLIPWWNVPTPRWISPSLRLILEAWDARIIESSSRLSYLLAYECVEPE